MERIAWGVVALLVMGCTRSAGNDGPKVTPVESGPTRFPTENQDRRAQARSLTPRTTAGSPDAATVAVLQAAFKSDDWSTRLVAAQAVGEARSYYFVADLVHALGDPEHDVRMAAVEALGQLPRTQLTVEKLVSVRDDAQEDLDIRALAAAALITP